MEEINIIQKLICPFLISSPVWIACSPYSGNEKFTELLLKNGSDLNKVENKEGKSLV